MARRLLLNAVVSVLAGACSNEYAPAGPCPETGSAECDENEDTSPSAPEEEDDPTSEDQAVTATSDDSGSGDVDDIPSFPPETTPGWGGYTELGAGQLWTCVGGGDSTVWMAGSHWGDDGRQTGWSGRLSGEAELDWEHRFDTDQSAASLVAGIAVLDANSVVVSGQSSAGFWASRLSTDGTTFWDFTPTEATGAAVSVIPASDATFRIVGVAPGHDLFAGALDQNGKLLWSTQRPLPGPGTGRAVAVDADLNSYFVGGLSPTQDLQRPWIGKYSPQGELIWERWLLPESFSGTATGVKVAADHRLVVSGGGAEPNQDDSAFLWTYALDGTALTEFEDPDISGYLSLDLHEEGIVAVGITMDERDDGLDAALSGFNLDGTLDWRSSQDFGSSEVAECVVALSPKRYAVGGWTSHPRILKWSAVYEVQDD